MNTKFNFLLQPFMLNSVELKNRIVMPPMVTNFAAEDGTVTEKTMRHYVARAKGGVGLIIVEATCMDAPQGKGFNNGLHIDDDRFASGLRGLVDAVHQHGARIGIQLHHAGSQAPYSVTQTRAVGPSAMPSPDPADSKKLTRELSEKEIKTLVSKFADAAFRAKAIGFDCVELHAAHFYLIAQFLTPLMNFRDDTYGGSLENRARFLTEIIRAVKHRVGNEYPVICRLDSEQLSADGSTNESPTVACMAQAAGADAIDVSLCGKIFATPPKTRISENVELLADTFRKAVSAPILFGGGMGFENVSQIIKHGKIDLATIGRGLIVDPELPNKIAAGTLNVIIDCIDCRACLDRVMTSRPVLCSKHSKTK